MRLHTLVLALSCTGAVLRAEHQPPPQRAGDYEVTLRLPGEGLYAREEMELEFRIVDVAHTDPVMGPTPVIRARVNGIIDMPAMPGMPKFDEVAHAEGIPGEYGLHPTFAHGGEFRIRLSITPPEAKEFTVEFPIQVADGNPAGKHKPKPAAFRMELKAAPRRPKAGEPVDYEIVIHARNNPKAIVNKLELTHQKLMHLLIVREDLAHFSHQHPEMSIDGVFRGRYTFPAPGIYHLFADIAPKGAGSQYLMLKLEITGKVQDRFDITRATAEERGSTREAGAVKVTLKTAGERLPARKTCSVSFSLHDIKTGKPVTNLEPYLGAMGHLMLIHQDGVTFVHSHPDERNTDGAHDGAVSFLTRLPKSGLYRAWAQFQRQGDVITADFVVAATE